MALLVGATACNSDNNGSGDSSRDCAVTSVVMGRLSRVYHGYLSDGRDTTYTTNVWGQYYPLHIDQLRREIFNSDSLPVGTKLDKVYFNTFASDGILAYRLESGKDTLFNIKDTLDFTTPRIFTVYTSDGSGTREYVMRINVHNADPEGYSWRQAAPADDKIAAMQDMRLIMGDGKMMLWGHSGGQALYMERTLTDGDVWSSYTIDGVSSLSTANVQSFNGKYYAPTDGGLACSADGHSWSVVAPELTGARIMGTAGGSLYVISGGKVWSSTDALSWTEDSVDDKTAPLPDEYVGGAYLPSANNANVGNLICVGYHSGLSETWKKEVNLVYPEAMPWSYYPATEETPRTLPYLGSMSLMPYDGKLMVIGQTADTLNVYTSSDGARSWQKVTRPDVIPSGAGRQTAVAWTADGDDTIWLVGAPAGILWRGYLNRMKAQTEE